jgi:hypothetical protein
LRLENRKSGSIDELEIVDNRIVKDDRLLTPPPWQRFAGLLNFRWQQNIGLTL